MENINAAYAPTQSFSGLKCFCTSSSSCGWSSSVPSESTVVDSTGARCNDDIDNDCDGKCDFDTSGCKTSTREGAGLNECPTCADAGGQACYTSQPSTWGSCGAQKTMGDPYCYAKSGSTYECYGCASGCDWNLDSNGGECCINEGSNCYPTYSWAQNDECCFYNSADPDARKSTMCLSTGQCGQTDVCGNTYAVCSSSVWNIACLISIAPKSTACCLCQLGYPAVSSSCEEDIISN